MNSKLEQWGLTRVELLARRGEIDVAHAGERTSIGSGLREIVNAIGERWRQPKRS